MVLKEFVKWSDINLKTDIILIVKISFKSLSL